METYKYHCKLCDSLIYDFTLVINNHKTRFKGEGILQQVLLYNENGHIFYDNNFGKEYAYEYFQTIDNTIIGGEWEFWPDDQFNDFKDWLLISLSPKSIQRKVKLNKIINKI